MIVEERRKKMIEGKDKWFHGAATARKNYNTVKKGTSGMVTAYLPEQNIFAVLWPENKFLTYNCTEEEFEEMFKLSSPDEVLFK